MSNKQTITHLRWVRYWANKQRQAFALMAVHAEGESLVLYEIDSVGAHLGLARKHSTLLATIQKYKPDGFFGGPPGMPAPEIPWVIGRAGQSARTYGSGTGLKAPARDLWPQETAPVLGLRVVRLRT